MHAVACDKMLKEKSAEVCFCALSLSRPERCYVQKGRYIETVSSVIDFENLSFKKHYYWPGLETLKAVSCGFPAIMMV
jgi:hypothetical protein